MKIFCILLISIFYFNQIIINFKENHNSQFLTLQFHFQYIDFKIINNDLQSKTFANS